METIYSMDFTELPSKYEMSEFFHNSCHEFVRMKFIHTIFIHMAVPSP